LAPLLERRPWVAGANGVSNYDRVTQGLKMVQRALGPFVHRELCGRFDGKAWTEGVLPVLSDVYSHELPGADYLISMASILLPSRSC
jgi:hypothetical protein